MYVLYKVTKEKELLFPVTWEMGDLFWGEIWYNCLRIKNWKKDVSFVNFHFSLLLLS